MRRGLQVLVGAIGVVAVGAGLAGVLLGADQVLGPGTASPGVDSELRFFAAWYVVAGLLLLRTVREVEREAWTIRIVAGGFLLAAIGRMLSIASAGWPHPLYVVLTVIEVVLPFVVVPWQTVVGRGTAEG